MTTPKKRPVIPLDVTQISDLKMSWVREISEDTVQMIARDLAVVIQEKQQVYPLIIDSYGGDVYSLLSILDLLDTYQGIVVTIGLKAISCGAVLLTCGTPGHRYVSPRATVMIHDVSMEAHSSKIEDLDTNLTEMVRVNTILWSLLDKNTGYPLHEQMLRRTKSDWYLTPKRARELRLADHVGIPLFEVCVQIDPLQYAGS